MLKVPGHVLPKTSDNIKNNKNDSKIIHLSSSSVVKSQYLLFIYSAMYLTIMSVSCPSGQVTLCFKQIKF